MDIEDDIRVIARSSSTGNCGDESLDNAVKYGVGKDVTVHLSQKGDKGLLKVVDQVGIADAEKVFSASIV